MVAALTKIESRPGLGRERRHGNEGWGQKKHSSGLLLAPPNLPQGPTHTIPHSIPHPMESLLLGWEDWCSLSPTCSCR